MLIKNWSLLIRCLQGHGTKNEEISHFGNSAGAVMRRGCRVRGQGPQASC